EGNCLKNETIKAAGKSVYIPMQGSVESLNASISGAILMYEAARQRR
ncbi:MAG TPA: 23S rRNA (guanosine(2251)-2'-O)-methyltransferase RlmB, partial [Lachnospiraceae bacterium]|nr:23S rRNA (guanosine(2251)-2'-O)-methyltransferase RlmB [Lachnospiraceae bacterium]